jgi:ArsR family transcriptional regulator
MRVLDLPQAKVSRHLTYLRRAGLVAGRKEQQWIHYRLLPAKGKFHAKLLECLSFCMGEVPSLREDRSRLICCAASGKGCAVKG